MSNDYETLQRLSEKVGHAGGNETSDGPHIITRTVLRALISELTKRSWGAGYTIDIDTIRAIANATKTDPLDELSPEDRLGYALAVDDFNKEFANATYFGATDRPKLDMQRYFNKRAAAVVAEYERQKGGDE